MYEIQKFIDVEMDARTRTYRLFSGGATNLIRILQSYKDNKAAHIAVLKLKQDITLRDLIDSGYSFVLKLTPAHMWMFEHPQRPADTHARAVILDIERTVYTDPGWFTSTHGMGTQFTTTKTHTGRIVGITAVLIFSYIVLQARKYF